MGLLLASEALSEAVDAETIPSVLSTPGAMESHTSTYFFPTEASILRCAWAVNVR